MDPYALLASGQQASGPFGGIRVTKANIVGGIGVTSADGTITVSAADDLSVAANKTNQQVKIDLSGTPVGTRKEINLIPGLNIGITVTDNSGSDRVDVTLDWVPATVSKTANYTATNTDYWIFVDATGGAVTIKGPATVVIGKQFCVSKIDVSANAVTFVGNTGQTVLGTASTTTQGRTLRTIGQVAGASGTWICGVDN